MKNSKKLGIKSFKFVKSWFLLENEIMDFYQNKLQSVKGFEKIT